MSPLLDFSGRGFDLSANARAPLAPWATPLQQARYEDYARGPDAFDCMGLVEWVQRLIGRPVRDYATAYQAHPLTDTAALDAIIRAEVGAWRTAEPGDVGDVLVLGLGRRAHHVAILCGAGRAIHAHSSAGIAIKEIAGRRAVTRFENMRVYGVVAPA